MLGFIIGAFALGLAKAAVFHTRRDGEVGLLDAVGEELVFRSGLQGYLGAPVPLSAVAFGLYHLDGGTLHPVARVADATVGGLLYGAAYASHGFWGSLATHLTHNVALQLGSRA